MVVRSRDAKKRQFKGITFDLLAVGEKTMLTRMTFKAGDVVPPHGHPNEQTGYVLSGRIRITCAAFDETLEPGDTYSVPAGMDHSAKAIEDTVVLDFFVPPREEYR
ncbi:MAG TPA: cupin domain-containing protein [Phycisphaerae bacterium]|nr:cupin domain-containing protein [Phycisphaerae bacterium]